MRVSHCEESVCVKEERREEEKEMRERQREREAVSKLNIFL